MYYPALLILQNAAKFSNVYIRGLLYKVVEMMPVSKLCGFNLSLIVHFLKSRKLRLPLFR